MAPLHLSPCGIPPRSSSCRELAFQPGLCKQPSLHRVQEIIPLTVLLLWREDQGTAALKFNELGSLLNGKPQS